jgi:ferritin-like metal-binding protein YciE
VRKIPYIQDAEAAERNFEDALAAFGKTGEQNQVKSFFERASAKAKTQHERLEARLRELGSSPSTAKSLLAHLLAFSTTASQIGHQPAEKNTQHLIMCVGAAAAEMAMYESLAVVAAAAVTLKPSNLQGSYREKKRITTIKPGHC